MTEEEEQEEELKSVKLKVKKSKITIGGRARLHSDVIVELRGPEEECEEECKEEDVEEMGDLIVVATEDTRILVRAFWDQMIDKDVISLRPPDYEKLGVDEGDEVEVYLHTTIDDALKQGWTGVKEKWGSWMEKVKDKFKKKDEEEEEE